MELHRVKIWWTFARYLQRWQSSFVYLCICIWRKSPCTHWFVVLPFRNVMQYWNADERINSGDDQAIIDINFLGFWPLPPEVTQINCVQQASISTRVSISTFARWQHGYFSLLLARGDTATPSGLYARLCHAFPVIHVTTNTNNDIL